MMAFSSRAMRRKQVPVRTLRLEGMWTCQSELRINFGPGYRVYFVRDGSIVSVLLCGGDKSTQDKDIRLAKKLAQQLKE